MASIDSMLSRLFGRAKAPAAPAPEAAAPAPEEAVPAPAPEPPEPDRPRPELQLPPEHPLERLWSLYSRERPELSPPRLCLEAREDMSQDDVEAELAQLQTFVSSTAKRRLELAQPERQEEGGPSLPDLDAQAAVFVPRSGLTAWVLVYPPVGGGRELGREDLTQALEQEQVSYGVDDALLDALPQEPDRYFRLFPAARGDAPEHGADGKVMDLFPRTVERSFAVGEDNRADYTSMTLFSNVEKDSVICRILPPAEGVPGRIVRDQEIPARDGRPASVPKGRNTHVSEEGDALLASISGQVEFSGRSFQVKPVLEIPGDVDFSTGNINFVGDVHIRGDICAGFTVRSMGSITVDGVVEACSVEAGGDLVVARGVQGDGQAVIRAQRDIFAKYLENCTVYVKKTLHTDCVINCSVYCDGVVEVRSGRMTIIGGTIRAAREVTAGTIGSRMEGRTDIILGGEPCGDLDYDLLIREARELGDEIQQVERQPDSPMKLSRLSKLRVKLIVAQKKLAELHRDEEPPEPEGEPEAGPRRMQCDTVYPGTVLTIDGTVYTFDRRLSPCSASLADGEIRLI